MLLVLRLQVCNSTTSLSLITKFILSFPGLSHLLKDTDFFENDLKNVQMPGSITMIDLTIEAVCDRFDIAMDDENESLLQFVRILIKHSGAR